MSSDNEIPLLERAELPQFMEIPKEARQPLTVLERDFVSAEVELSKLILFYLFCSLFVMPLVPLRHTVVVCAVRDECVNGKWSDAIVISLHYNHR